jgi:hypothetical protein
VGDEVIAWKEELVRVAFRLEAKTKQTRWTYKTGVVIEQDFVASAYAMRKLVQSRAVSDEIRRRRFPVRRFDSNSTLPGPRFPDDIADFYDFENGRRTTLSVADLCQEIVDSTVFAFCCGETTDLFDGIYLTADRGREHVYLVLASDYIALCDDASRT